MNNDTALTVKTLKEEGQDFEWYPTTDEMIRVVRTRLPENARSILDIGAGDGRVLEAFAQKCREASLYSIEKSPILAGKQAANIIPVGTELFEQQLASLQMDYIFCNPRYSEFEEWVCKIIDEGYAKVAYLVIPVRWRDSAVIANAIKKRGATARPIFVGDFHNAQRQARAVIEILEVDFPKKDDGWKNKVRDPFDIWFDANVGTFDQAEPPPKESAGEALAKRLSDASIDDMVEAYNAEYKILIDNYQAIFKLDYMILHELGINKEAVREGIKTKMAGLKVLYWQTLFNRLNAITSRLTTRSKKAILEKLTNRTNVAFTVGNCYVIVIWAIKNANKYFDEQAVQLFYDLSAHDGVTKYKSNLKTWSNNNWRYSRDEEREKRTHFKLDYRIVHDYSYAIRRADRYEWDYPANLYQDRHQLLDDVRAVFSNLGFTTTAPNSRRGGEWRSGQWHNFYHTESEEILFQAKAYINGNMHFRFMPEAIMALNVYVARSLKWVRNVQEVVEEMDVPVDQAFKWFNHSPYITTASVKLLNG